VTRPEILSIRVPNADFTPYFAFLASLVPLGKGGHEHHILPQKEFPEFMKDPNNLIRLTPGDHFKAHYWLARCAPKHASFQITFFLMSNRKFSQQVTVNKLPEYTKIYERGQARQAEGGRIQGRRNKENGSIQKLGASGAGGNAHVKSGFILELGKKWGAKNFAKARTPKHQSVAGRTSSHVRWHVKRGIISPACRICLQMPLLGPDGRLLWGETI